MPGLGKGYWEGALGVRGVWGGGGVGVYGVINQRVKCTLKVISFVEVIFSILTPLVVECAVGQMLVGCSGCDVAFACNAVFCIMGLLILEPACCLTHS